MTVKELIKELKKYDQDVEVRIADWQEGICPPEILNKKDIKTDKYENYFEERFMICLAFNKEDMIDGNDVFLKLGDKDEE